jgi:hypothetical protein
MFALFSSSKVEGTMFDIARARPLSRFFFFLVMCVC